jgi:hypothetical protein
MDSKYWGTEVAYKNGFKDALNETALRKAICESLQNTNFPCDKVCKQMCGSIGECAFCGTMARGIRAARGVE